MVKAALLIAVLIAVVLVFWKRGSPEKAHSEMSPVTDIADAKRRIQAHTGPAEAFALPVANSLLDPVGVNMAIIADCILARGWEPDGFVQHANYRLFRYKSSADSHGH